MATQAEQLAKFVAALHFDDIPAEVIGRVKLHLLDTLGIGLAASPLEYARLIVETVRTWSGAPQSTVWRPKSAIASNPGPPSQAACACDCARGRRSNGRSHREHI